MEDTIRLGSIICDRYRTCAGGKCLRALHNREGAFERYNGKDVELIGFATRNGCRAGALSMCRRRLRTIGRRSSILPPLDAPFPFHNRLRYFRYVGMPPRRFNYPCKKKFSPLP